MEQKEEDLLQEVMTRRGFVLDFHKVMVREDPEFMKCYEALINHVSTQKRTLDKKIKAFIYIGVLTALQASLRATSANISSVPLTMERRNRRSWKSLS